MFPWKLLFKLDWCVTVLVINVKKIYKVNVSLTFVNCFPTGLAL